MNDITLRLKRSLSATMRDALISCHNAVISNQEPYEAGSLKYVKGLINRGLLEPRPYISTKGKPYTAVYITALGETFLKHYQDSPANN